MSAHRLIIGPLPTHGASSGSSLWAAIGHLTGHDLETVAIPALTLSVLLSIDTLKTCVVTDAVTRTRHDSNRELRAQGLANFASGLAGGVPVAGTMGATMVNVSSGGTTRWSGIFEGIFMLLGVLVLRPVIAWTPLAALAGILVVVGFRMVNWKAFAMLRQPSTRFDFAVIAVVAGVAIGIGLITAAGVGLALAILLFIRDQVRGNVIRRKTYGSRVFSRSRRLPEEMEVLVQRGGETTILELQGNLFFGTTDQLQTDLQADLKTCRYLILDLRRVQSVDYTAVHLFEILEGQVAEKGGALVFAHVPPQLPTGQDLKAYFSELGLTGPHRHVHVFPEQSDALEWVEERTLAEALPGRLSSAARAGLSDLVLMRGLDPETVNRVAACAREVPVKRGEAIFRKGSSGDELFLVQRGTVRILLPMADGSAHHIATFGPGDFFGDMAFLDREIRSADAVAWEDCELLALSRARFDDLVKQDPVLGTRVFARLAKALAARLRYTDIEVGALSET
jgi:SulP family sulfate permease